MVKSKDLREVAISHFQKGKKASEIATLLGNKVHHITIHRWLSQFKESGEIEVKKKFGRPKTGRTKRLINLVKNGLILMLIEKLYERWPKISIVAVKTSDEY